MSAYAKTMKMKPFDWNDFLDRAIKKKPKYKEWNKAVKLSSDWITCACGNQCDIIDRESDGEPTDEELSILGMDFHHCINAGYWEDAKETLKEIEKRSAKLIKEKINESIKILKKFNYKVTKA